VPYRQEAELVLAMWRDVRRALAGASPHAPETKLLEEDAARLRDEYLRLIERARATGRPEPPPFPDESPEASTPSGRGR
jgi:hypothetical protein